MSALRIIISGGGTGGHIFPAIAVANAVKTARPDAQILFVGASGKMEMEKVPKAGYNIVGLPIRGIQRKLSLKNLTVPFRLIYSLWKSRTTIKKFKPEVVIGFGGYASAAVVYTASRMGIKTMIQEQNSYPGVTNKILANRVTKICVAFEGMEKFFPSQKIMLTGNPIRQDIVKNAGLKSDGIKEFHLDANKKTILAIGGSLGARTINEAMMELIPHLESLNAQLLWQCGSIYYDEMFHRVSGDRGVEGLDDSEAHDSAHSTQNFHLLKFIERMDLAYAAADMVISRSGALSVSEITALRKPSILIPSPHVAEDHQTKNAASLAKHEAAILLKDSEAKEKIVETVRQLTTDNQQLTKLRDNLDKVFSSSNAAQTIANQIFQLAETK